MCNGSEAGSYLRLIDFAYHSTLGVRVIKKKKMMAAGGVPPAQIVSRFSTSISIPMGGNFGFRQFFYQHHQLLGLFHSYRVANRWGNGSTGE